MPPRWSSAAAGRHTTGSVVAVALADWLVMAATLTQLRARLILPATTSETQAATREAEGLRRQLLSRQHIQAAADWLERRQQLGLQVWARGRSEQGVAGVRGEEGDLAGLMRACLVALALPDQLAEAYRMPPRTLWPVPASIARIRERLAVAAGWQRADVPFCRTWGWRRQAAAGHDRRWPARLSPDWNLRRMES